MSEPKNVIHVHPDDLNLADVKAVAAQYDSTVVANRFVPRGKVFVFDGSVVRRYLAP